VHHSRSRMNAFRALASPSLICLTSKDPILSAFQLSWELRRLSFEEHEFRSEYKVNNHDNICFKVLIIFVFERFEFVPTLIMNILTS
jgi:hypothetical protein